MSRENRRVAAISWSWTGSAGNGENLPPPKPSRVPAAYVGIGGSAGKSVTSASSDAIAFWTKDVPSGAQQRSFGATDARMRPSPTPEITPHLPQPSIRSRNQEPFTKTWNFTSAIQSRSSFQKCRLHGNLI
ncbi:hypothetical protein DAPPUDRAFT_107584 [Daphnia pulex]|uniref:Uncharacterized protein n=1 Tax=Daphnia pulex TaxID=6669 RepID=E9GXM2_DAPPU|nr:hypothetical protein DAPPUDRAFT_107584 [Daphnia pulex]|eukprot:EFX75790.1 hypothetical protein DAPPUDRAFT_107584 [Daphnia pulex]